MSWLYLPESAVASSAQNTDSAGAPSVMSSETRMPSEFLPPAFETDGSTTPPFGTTPALLTGVPGLDAWMSSLRASRASHSAWPENEPGPMTNETDGLTPFALFEKSAPLLSSLRTSLAYSAQWIVPQRTLFGTSVPFSETWPRAGTVCGGGCYRRRKWERRIKEIGSGLWPTIKASRRGDCPSERKRKSPDLSAAVKMWPTPRAEEAAHPGRVKIKPGQQVHLSAAVKMFPTPNAFDAKSSDGWVMGSTHDRQKKEHTLPQFVQAFPTPNARDWRSGKGREENGHTPQLPEVVGGQLNPDWVEWLMGWPIGWTALEPLATDRFQQWRRALFGY